MESSCQSCLAHALIMQPSTESSSQPQPERAPPTSGKPCAIIVPVLLSTRDNAIQTTKIKTSARSADVTTQSASSADSTKTPANSATAEIQKQLGARQEELAGRKAAEHTELLERLRANCWKGCEQQQRLLDEQQLAMSDSAKAAVPEIGALVSVSCNTDTSVSPIRADAGSPSAGLIMAKAN